MKYKKIHGFEWGRKEKERMIYGSEEKGKVNQCDTKKREENEKKRKKDESDIKINLGCYCIILFL